MAYGGMSLRETLKAARLARVRFEISKGQGGPYRADRRAWGREPPGEIALGGPDLGESAKFVRREGRWCRLHCANRLGLHRKRTDGGAADCRAGPGLPPLDPANLY